MPGGGLLLDIGTGSGYIAREVGKRRPDAWCIGVDVDAAAIAHAKQDNPDNVTFQAGDLYEGLDGVFADVIAITVPWEGEDAYPDATPRRAYVDDEMILARALAGARGHLEHAGRVLVLGPEGLENALNLAGLAVDYRMENPEWTVFVARSS